MEEETTQSSQPNKKTKTWFLVIIVILTLVLGSFILFLSIRQKPTPPSPPVPTQEEELPTSEDFNEVVTQIKTPQELVDYLNKNFVLEVGERENPLNPREFFEKKKGNSWDFAVFVSYVLWYNKYESSIIRYKYDENKINAVVVFRDTDLPKTIIFTENEAIMYPHGWSFTEMFQKEEERLNSKITEYAVSYWTDRGELWPEKWIERQF